METGLCCEGFTSDWNQACFDAPLVFVCSGSVYCSLQNWRAKASAKRVKSARHAQRGRRRRTCLALHARFVLRSPEKKGEKAPVRRRCLSWKENYWKLICMRVFFLVTEKEEESWGEVIREGRNEPKGERNLWSSVNEGSRNQRQIKRGKLSTFFCLFIFLKGPCRADIAVLETDHYFFDGGRGVGKFLHANIFLNVSVFLQTLYFLLAYNLFQCLQPLQTIYSKIFYPPTPCQKNNGPSLRAPLCLSHYLMSRKQQVCSVCLFC